MSVRTPDPDPGLLFDRRLLRLRRERVARRGAVCDFLHREVAGRLLDRLADIRRHFPVALDLGCHTGHLSAGLRRSGQVGWLVAADLAPGLAARAGLPALALDEEALPFAAGSLDAVFSGLALHQVNDLPGVLRRIRHCLKPDGLFLAMLPGGETLAALRHGLLAAETACTGRAAPRVAPFLRLEDAASLMQQAGFTLPVVDADPLEVTYDDLTGLLADLRQAGEANTLVRRAPGGLRRDVLAAARDACPRRADGRIVAAGTLVTLSGWAPGTGPRRDPPGGDSG